MGLFMSLRANNVSDRAGWRLETIITHNRNDKYYFPPGISRGPGNMVRRDFFDSAKQVRVSSVRDACFFFFVVQHGVRRFFVPPTRVRVYHSCFERPSPPPPPRSLPPPPPALQKAAHCDISTSSRRKTHTGSERCFRGRDCLVRCPRCEFYYLPFFCSSPLWALIVLVHFPPGYPWLCTLIVPTPLH